MGSKSAINDLLECPICMTFMHPPIYQCCNGHPICYSCKGRVKNTCPVCRKRLGKIRCLVLENLAELIDIPCEFHDSGCQALVPHNNRLSHKQVCPFRPYKCPYDEDGCSVTGDIASLFAHLKEIHIVDVINLSTFKRSFFVSILDEISYDVWRFSIVNCFGHQFYIHFEYFILENAPVLMAFLRFMGEETEAKKFRYYLEVSGKKRPMRWQGIPRSIRDSDMAVRHSLDGLIIRKTSLPIFLSGDGGDCLKLNVAGRIWRK